MSDYTQATDFTAKDGLASGNPLKLVRGSEFDTEFGALEVAIATKYDSNDLADQSQAEAETSNTVLVTPLRMANWADYNAGIVGDLQAMADPGADRVLGWDESANAAIGFTVSGALAFSGTDLTVSAAAILAQLLTVDGGGSGLDADLLDGNNSSYYVALGNATGTLAVGNGGTGVTTQAAITRAVTLAWTIQSDPGGTPSGSPGDVFAYY